MPILKKAFDAKMYSESDLVFHEETHTFTLKKGNITLPGVTSVLEASGLISDFAKSAIASAYGTAVHNLIRLDVANSLDESSLDDGLKNPLEGWRRFRENNLKLIPIFDRVEKPTFHPVHMYAGIPDLPMLDTFDGSLVVIDIKTATSKYEPHWELQTAAYEGCLRYWMQLKPFDWVKRKILWLTHKEPIYDLITLEDTSAWPAWLGMLNAYKWKLANGYVKPPSMIEVQ